jgi:hypothetical protein
VRHLPVITDPVDLSQYDGDLKKLDTVPIVPPKPKSKKTLQVIFRPNLRIMIRQLIDGHSWEVWFEGSVIDKGIEGNREHAEQKVGEALTKIRLNKESVDRLLHSLDLSAKLCIVQNLKIASTLKVFVGEQSE